MNFIEFVKKFCKNPIEVSRKDFWKGILLMLFSWQCIALGINVHVLPMDSWLVRYVDFSAQMFLATIALLLISIIYVGFVKGHGLKNGYRYLKITRENEVVNDCQTRHLSFAQRISAIYIRAALATSGYFLFELARVYIGVIDNSALHGADALFYAVLFGRWVERKINTEKVYTKLEWIGMAISAGAILFAFICESSTISFSLASAGVAEGVGSAVMLASVVLITSIVVYHDSVIRIAFHNCLFGFATSFILLIGTIYAYYDGRFSEIVKVLQMLDWGSTAVVSATYAVALLGFFQSYKYIKPVLIAMLGNSLGFGTIFLTVSFHRH